MLLDQSSFFVFVFIPWRINFALASYTKIHNLEKNHNLSCNVRDFKPHSNNSFLSHVPINRQYSQQIFLIIPPAAFSCLRCCCRWIHCLRCNMEVLDISCHYHAKQYWTISLSKNHKKLTSLKEISEFRLSEVSSSRIKSILVPTAQTLHQYQSIVYWFAGIQRLIEIEQCETVCVDYCTNFRVSIGVSLLSAANQH